MKDEVKKVGKRKADRAASSVIPLGFLVLILLGTVLLCLPVSSAAGEWTNPLDACFTAVSATCVTGLSTVTAATHWSVFGQVVMLLLIQVGGLGFMAMAVAMSLLLRRAVSPKERMLVAMSYNLNDLDSIVVLLKRILRGTAVIEAAGAVLLSVRMIPVYGVGRGIYYSIFHSVSAFCNAGFDVLGDASLTPFATDPWVTATVMALIILGGIGFLVWSDTVNVFLRRKRRLSVYSKLVLIASAVLVFGGALLFALLEWNNPATVGGMSAGDKILSCFFHSVSTRTAGFFTFPNGGMTDGAKFASMLWMFVGGASGSTAGGVKVVTVTVLLWSVCSVAVGKKKMSVFGRRLPLSTCVRASAVVTFQLLLVFAGTLVLGVGQKDIPLIDLLYEAVSAVSTVGLSTGITPTLGTASKITLIFLMYFGRVGILSVTYAMMENLQKDDSCISYPDANLLIG